MTTSQLLIMAAVLILAANIQGVSGMGFGMTSVPIISLMIGSANGVLWGNITGAMSAAALAWTKRKDIEWKRYGLMIAGCLPAVALTAWLLSYLNKAYMDLVVGGLMAVMMIFSVVALRFPPVHGKAPAVITGVVSGMLSASVAQAGPALTAYAQASRWKQTKFAATLQPYFLTMNLFVIPSKLIAGVGTVEHFTLTALIVAAVAVAIGAFIARYTVKKVPPHYARYLALALGGIGAVLILARGITSVFF